MTLVVECPSCHRPLCELDWIEGRAHVMGGVYPDSANAAGRISVPGGDDWRARVTITDPALSFGATYDGRGRKTLTCRRRGHRSPLSWPVTQATLDATYRRAVATGRSRVSAAELRG